MGGWLFNLNEEILIDGTIETRCFISSCFFVLFLWILNIITGVQFIILFMFYISWMVLTLYSINKLDEVFGSIDKIKKKCKDYIYPSNEIKLDKSI